MASVQDRLKTKQSESNDTWSTREQLCLASSVLKSGDQNWISVSRSLKPFAEKEALRPPDWFSPKSCANQYTRLIENADTPKRKKRESGETIGESIVKRLTQKRIAELGQILAFQRDEYKQLKAELNLLKSGSINDDKLQKMWLAIKEEQEQKAKAHSQYLAERQQKQDLVSQLSATPLKKTLELNNEAHEESANDEEEIKRGSSSTLLTNLLKAPSPTKQIQNTIQTSTAQVTSPTIASLLNSNASVHMTTSALQNVTPPMHQIVTSVIPAGTPERPSAGAPTLSMLLALPANLPKGSLPTLPATKSETETVARSATPKSVNQTTTIQVPNTEAKITDTDNVGEIIERIDDVIGKDTIPDVIDKDEINEIMEDIEELIKEEITKSPQTEPTPVVIETFPVVEKIEERVETKSDKPISLTDSPESEMAIEEIDHSTSNIAEIIGTAIETPKEVEEMEEENCGEESKPEENSEGKEKEEEKPCKAEIKGEEKMAVDEEEKAEESKEESEEKAEGEEKFEEKKEEEDVKEEEKEQKKVEAKEEGEEEEKKEDVKSEEVCDDKAEVIALEEKVSEVKEESEEAEEESKKVKEEIKEEEQKGAEKEEVVDEEEKKVEEEKEEIKEKEVESEETESDEKIEDEKSEEEKVKEEKINEAEKEDEKIEADKEEEKVDKEEEEMKIEDDKEEEKEEMEAKVETDEKDKEESVEETFPDKIEDDKSEVEDKISEDEIKVENEESAKEEEAEESFDEPKEEKEEKEEEEKEEKEEVDETKDEDKDQEKEKVEKMEKEEEIESKGTEEVEVKKEESVNLPENLEVEEESSLIKLSGGRAMKTYSKKQNVAVDRDSEGDNIGEEGDYRNWKKAVLLVYQRFTQHKFASLFLRPITEDHAPGYHSVIFRPMDLSTIKKNIENGTIRSTMHFQRDVMLMFQNALMYNKPNTLIYKMAMAMQDDCLQEFQMLVGVTKDVSFRRETRTAGSSNSELNESNILKRKRSHITPSPHDSESPRMKKRRKSEND